MKLNSLIKFSLVLCLVGISATGALAYTSVGVNWQNNYPDTCPELQAAATAAMDCVLCHTSGFGMNAYGVDLENAGRDFSAIESMDSDGDGRTNGEEILIDCTLPGDSVSPTDSSSFGHIKVLFR